jgi:hypothetical protein
MSNEVAVVTLTPTELNALFEVSAKSLSYASQVIHPEWTREQEAADLVVWKKMREARDAGVEVTLTLTELNTLFEVSGKSLSYASHVIHPEWTAEQEAADLAVWAKMREALEGSR